MEDDIMEYFLLEHPPDRLILCNRSNCENIAEYLEVNQQGWEDFVCAAHTSSDKHASVLPKSVPSGAYTAQESTCCLRLFYVITPRNVHDNIVTCSKEEGKICR
jgi:hypothetical protein